MIQNITDENKITCNSQEQKVSIEQKIQKRSTGVTSVSHHAVSTIDYIHGSLVIHYTHDKTVISELVRKAKVVPYCE